MLRKHSVSIRGHQTSFSLEDEFFDQLKQISKRQGKSLAGLITKLDEKRTPTTNLSSTLRVFVLNELAHAHSKNTTAEIERFETGTRMSQMAIYGDLIWLAGQCGSPNKSVAEQTSEALLKIDRLLAEAGSDKTRIVNTTIWLSDISTYDEMNTIWDEWMPEGCPPTRACGESRLGGDGYDVEIICVAVRSR